MSQTVLVAGVGNVFFGDDAFGVEVVRRMREDPLPVGTEVVDYGIRGMHLAFALLNTPDLLVLVDTVYRGAAPGTLYLIDPNDVGEERANEERGPSRPDPHGMDLEQVFDAVHSMGGKLPRTRLVGCEPADLSNRMELSAPMLQAIPSAIAMIHQLIQAEVSDHEQAC